MDWIDVDGNARHYFYSDIAFVAILTGTASQAQAEALHRMGAGAAAAGQGSPQAQAAAAPLQAQGNAGGGQQAVLAQDFRIQGGAWAAIWT
jgi:hypothetical protein